MSFRKYVKSLTPPDNAIGDFIRDAQMDDGLPDARSWAELEKHLISAGALPEAIEAARTVWNQYVRHSAGD